MALALRRRTNIASGQQVLVYGGSGANGTCAIQLAKYSGAAVTAVRSTVDVELRRSLGVEHGDYTKDHASAPGRCDASSN